MATFFVLLMFAAIIFLIVSIFRKSDKKKRNIWASIATIVVSFIIVGITAPTPEGKTGSKPKTEKVAKKDDNKKAVKKSDKKEKKKSPAKKSEKKKPTKKKKAPKKEKVVNKKKAPKKKKLTKNQKVNQHMAAYLKENQGFADGSLDENGNPTQNGTPNKNFAYSLLVSKIKVDVKNMSADIYVTGEFSNASKSEKTQLAGSIQGMTQAGLSEVINMSDDDFKEGLHLYFYLGKNSIGSSKVLNAKKYTWY